ncbi:MAG: esterase/lipase family protein [Pseudomonadota bacterium]|jgi:triacylglycerol lipase
MHTSPGEGVYALDAQDLEGLEDLDALVDPDEDPNPFDHDPGVEPVYTPLWREFLWPTELARLLCSPLYRGVGVPRGHGEPVLVIPGFLANDLMMIPLRHWLGRIGYRPYHSDITWNTDCPNKTALRLLQKIKVIHRKTGRRVILLGHSLGGMLAKSILQHAPELIDRVITLGSPFRDHVRAHPAVTGIWEYLLRGQGKLVGRNLHASCGTGFCMCDFVRHMLQPEARDIPQFAIYSRNDGVVDWTSCAEEDPGANIEVNEATHIGLIFHPRALAAIAQRLAEPVAGADPG